MRVSYDSRTDTLTVIFREDVRVSESDEDKPGTILDYDSKSLTHPKGLPSLEKSNLKPKKFLKLTTPGLDPQWFSGLS